ncbi:hypothetical protein IVB34_22105 [Bradyrhizobium sp. 2]|uniref:hypothetical protein n=1 Tax=unclassified Bradyrhizobium TaxID=2631580 RepID=UPI001FF90ED2|nr:MULTISPECIES: hypothetical protein [unclassified Bradyrhizobium]MCK1445871.1 hypothetical protein [Bradyrhizobium sp. 48]MCK1460980.1 hypothetical protein [Bradyrhizobium sp. 2]
MRKRRATQVVARRLGLNFNRAAALVQRVSEAGLLPVTSGSTRPDLSHRQLGLLVIAAVADRGLGNALATTSEMAAIESNGLRFDDWLESAIAGRVNAAPILSVVFQLEPAAVTVLTSARQLEFGQSAHGATTRVTAISGEALRAIIQDFSA